MSSTNEIRFKNGSVITGIITDDAAKGLSVDWFPKVILHPNSIEGIANRIKSGEFRLTTYDSKESIERIHKLFDEE